MLSDILSEYMGDDIAKVHQDPLGGPIAFDAQRLVAGAREDAPDMIGNGTRLAIRIRRAYHQVVRNRGQGRDLKDNSIGGLLVKHGPSDGEGRRPSCLCDYDPLGRDDDGVYKIPLRAATDLPPDALGGFASECRMRRSG